MIYNCLNYVIMIPMGEQFYSSGRSRFSWKIGNGHFWGWFSVFIGRTMVSWIFLAFFNKIYRKFLLGSKFFVLIEIPTGRLNLFRLLNQNFFISEDFLAWWIHIFDSKSSLTALGVIFMKLKDIWKGSCTSFIFEYRTMSETFVSKNT